MKKFKILHLDDHELIGHGVKKILLELNPSFEYSWFPDSSSLLQHLRCSLKKGNDIDLIVTDFVHPGQNGYQLAKIVKSYEKRYKRTYIPVILCTLMKKTVEPISQGLAHGIFSSYVSLTESEEAIRAAFIPFLPTKN